MEKPEIKYMMLRLREDEFHHKIKEMLRSGKYEIAARERDEMYNTKREAETFLKFCNRFFEETDLNQENFEYMRSVCNILGGTVYSGFMMQQKIKKTLQNMQTDTENGVRPDKVLINFLNVKKLEIF